MAAIAWRGVLLLAIGFFLLKGPGVARGQDDSGERSLVILHTNDIHDHLRPDYDGRGGMPYVSGYIRRVRAERRDVLVLDAGDVAEKGDLVARETGSRLTFEALARAGYDAWTPGNHDHNYGIEALHAFGEVSGEADLLCINLLGEDGSPVFKPSAIYERGGVRVGVIGAIVPRDERSLTFAETAVAMQQEATRLAPQTDLIVGLVHLSSERSARLAEAAPEIDVFVTGHSHEEIREAIRVPRTGALIVQAGSYGDYVGRLELTIAPESGQVTAYEANLVEMNHASVTPDVPLMSHLRTSELNLVPEAREIVGWLPEEMGYAKVGVLAAAALRETSGADVAFNYTAGVVRSKLPAGVFDVNAVYRTGGERGRDLVETELTGAEIAAYLRGLHQSDWYPTQWSGFRGGLTKEGIFETDLDPARHYRVVMTEREWQRRFSRLFERVAQHPEQWKGVGPLNRPVRPEALDLTWTQALRVAIEEWNQDGGVLSTLRTAFDETGQSAYLETVALD